MPRVLSRSDLEEGIVVEIERVIIPAIIEAMSKHKTLVGSLSKAAQGYHIDNPHDAAHDLEHHKVVVNNCLMIVEGEGLTGKVDLGALLVAAWWHDVKRDSLKENNELLRETASEVGENGAFVDKVIDIINSHSFGKSQPSVEAQILYDADKIEYVSKDRMLMVVHALRDGSMSKGIFKGHMKNWRNRIRIVRDSMHFETSKKFFDQKFKKAALESKKYSETSFVYRYWLKITKPSAV